MSASPSTHVTLAMLAALQEPQWRTCEVSARAMGLFDLANAYQQFADALGSGLGLPNDCQCWDRGARDEIGEQWLAFTGFRKRVEDACADLGIGPAPESLN